MKRENPIKVMEELKLDLLYRLNPEFVQVGDSSGALGPPPRIVEQYLNEAHYGTMSCCGDEGYAGHRYFAEVSLMRVPSIKYVVFYVSPFSTPLNFSNHGRDLANSIYSVFLSNWSRLNLPSLDYRLDVTNFVYYGYFSHSISINPANPDRDWELGKISWFLEDHGWLPTWPTLPANLEGPFPPIGLCDFSVAYANWFRLTNDGTRPIDHLYPELNKLASWGRRLHVPIILVFSPVSCERGNDKNTIAIEHEINRFRRDNPEIIMPFPFITTWPAELFRDPWHLFVVGGERMAHTLGPILRRVIDDPTYRGIPTSDGGLSN